MAHVERQSQKHAEYRREAEQEAERDVGPHPAMLRATDAGNARHDACAETLPEAVIGDCLRRR